MADQRWTWPDGQSVTVHEDGSVTVREPNGAETHYDPKTGVRTETPAGGGPPRVTQPNKPPKTENGEIEIRYPDGTRIYLKLNPRRVRIVRSVGEPRKWEVNVETGVRTVEPKNGDPPVATDPTTPQPEPIEPSTHPRPPEEPEGEKKGKKEKSKKKKAKRAMPKRNAKKSKPRRK